MFKPKVFELLGRSEQGLYLVPIATYSLKKAKKEYPALKGFFAFSLPGHWETIGNAYPQGSLRIMRTQ